MEDEIEYSVTFLVQISVTLTEEFGGRQVYLGERYDNCNGYSLIETVGSCMSINFSSSPNVKYGSVHVYSISLLKWFHFSIEV